VSTLDPGEGLPTWEQLLTGVGLGAAVPLQGRYAWWSAPAPRHVRSWPASGGIRAGHGTDEWSDEWAAIVRELQLDPGMGWREAWTWTSLATGCALVASHAVAGALR
jgi:hypothetical protein